MSYLLDPCSFSRQMHLYPLLYSCSYWLVVAFEWDNAHPSKLMSLIFSVFRKFLNPMFLLLHSSWFPRSCLSSLECASALQIGRGCATDRFWHIHVAAPVIICPLLLFLCGLWLVAWRTASSSVVQLADSDTVVLMTHCCCVRSPARVHFSHVSYYLLSHHGCVFAQKHLGSWFLF